MNQVEGNKMSEYLTAADLESRPVNNKPVPIKTPWGKPAFCRVMSAGERDDWEASMIDGKKVNRKHARAKFLLACLCDEAGAALFTAKHIPMLSGLPCPEIEPVYDQCLKINAFTTADLDELGNAPAA